MLSKIRILGAAVETKPAGGLEKLVRLVLVVAKGLCVMFWRTKTASRGVKAALWDFTVKTAIVLSQFAVPYV
jgi:hypothetical protein